jgi:hypothetical protein
MASSHFDVAREKSGIISQEQKGKSTTFSQEDSYLQGSSSDVQKAIMHNDKSPSKVLHAATGTGHLMMEALLTECSIEV